MTAPDYAVISNEIAPPLSNQAQAPVDPNKQEIKNAKEMTLFADGRDIIAELTKLINKYQS